MIKAESRKWTEIVARREHQAAAVSARDAARSTLTYLNGPDVAALALTDDEILAAVEAALAAQGRGETVIEPRVHLVPEASAKGHFNVLRGYVQPLGVAGVKVVGDFVDNYKHGLPSEMALLNLFDPQTGMPLAVIDAPALTDMRTGAMTALGAQASRAQGRAACSATSARAAPRTGTCACSTTCSTSTRSACTRAGPESRDAFAARLSHDLGKPVRRDRRLGVVRARRRHRRRGVAAAERRSRCCKTEWIAPRRVRRALRHDERGRALADRHHGQDGRRRLGPVPQGPAVRRAARARRQRAS